MNKVKLDTDYITGTKVKKDGRETLIEAQKSPEKYRDLIIRVAGYSAYFVQLGKPIQDEIIKRTEYRGAA